MRINHLVEKARRASGLLVSSRGGVTFVVERKRGGVGIVIWDDGSINRTDIPLAHQLGGLSVSAAAKLLGLSK